MVDVPSFIVRTDSAKHIDLAVTSPYAGGKPGRARRKRLRLEAEKAKSGGGEGGGEGEDM